MYSKPALVAAILGTISTVGWVVQGLGLAWYFREVRACCDSRFPDRSSCRQRADLDAPHPARPLLWQGQGRTGAAWRKGLLYARLSGHHAGGVLKICAQRPLSFGRCARDRRAFM